MVIEKGEYLRMKRSLKRKTPGQPKGPRIIDARPRNFGELLRFWLDARENRLDGRLAARIRTRFGISMERFESMQKDGLPPQLEWLETIANILTLSPAEGGELFAAAMKDIGLATVVEALFELERYRKLNGRRPSEVQQDAQDRNAEERAKAWEMMAELGPVKSDSDRFSFEPD